MFRWLQDFLNPDPESLIDKRLRVVERVAHLLEELGHGDLADELRHREDQRAAQAYYIAYEHGR